MPDCLQSAAANTATPKVRQRISTAPLHVARQSKHWISGDRLDKLREQFPFINTSRWSRKEKKRLRKNWRYLLKHHPNYSDPKFAFGIGHDSESQLSTEEVGSKKEHYENFNIMLRMAYKLNDRLICDIYMKCRKMFYDKSFYFNSRAQVPDELERRVRLDLAINESPQIIAHKYNIAPSVIDTIGRRPHAAAKRFKWTETAQNDLRESIESVHNVDDLNDLLARDINWKRVCTQMGSLGYALTKEQCYNKWIRLNPNLKGSHT